MSTRPRIVLVSRELHPFGGGGIGPIVAALATELASIADVTLVSSAAHRARSEALGGPEALYGPGVELLWVADDEPEGPSAQGWATYPHTWSGRVFAVLAERFAHGGPDLIEFCDYLGEGFVTLQARRTGEPFLRDTRIVVRTHTTAELTAVLNGRLRQDNATVALGEMERYALRHADALLDSGGDVRATYERYYGADALAPGRRVLEAFHRGFDAVPPAPPANGLRLLYLGRLERRKGVQNLARALAATDAEGWTLTLLGADTDTAPLGHSMREHLELALTGDDRVTFAEPVAREQVGAVIDAHDVVVVPSLWECWPNVVREALLHNRPVLATPTGGLTELVEHGVSGWLAEDASPGALRRALEAVVARPEAVREMIDARAPRAAFERVVDPDRTRREYLALLGELRPHRPRPPRGAPTVSVVVPYFELDAHVEETLDSIAAQTARVEEVVVVNDGALRPEDAVVDRLARERGLRLLTQPNSGLGAARNLGVLAATGRYVLPLDADNVLEPDYVERCLHALERDERLAYATTWTRWVDEDGTPLGDGELGYQPLGNWTRLVERNNWAGDGTALIRREVFDAGLAYSVELTSYEDWFLYRRMHHAGLHGDVIPHRLLRYRVRAASMLRTVGLRHEERLFDEMNALLTESEMTWTT
jgi:glycosyltransferase involved in cell wall biosynthesis